MKQILFALITCCLLMACNNAVQEPTEEAQTDTTATQPAALQLTGTDSVEVLFYPDPHNQKVYTRTIVADTGFIQTLQTNLQQDTVTRTECLHDVKMYLFRKGEVYKTIYAATADSCRYLAYAVNSRAYFVPMHPATPALISALRKRSE